VDVVGHEDPCMQVIEASLRCSVQQLFGYHLGDPWICQPFWPLLFSVKFSIFGYERMARGWIRLQQIFSFASRDRARESPVQEYRYALGMQVRQVSSIVKQESTGGSACRTLYVAAIS
jgi:hypothetical protein